MSVLPYIAPDLLGLALAVYLLFLVRENVVITRLKTGLFSRVILIAIATMILEIASVWLDTYGNASLDFVDEVIYVLIYLAAPVVILLLAMLFDDATARYRREIRVGAVICAILILPNLLTHGLFSVTGDTVYARGPLYPEYLVLCVVCGGVFMAASFHSMRNRNGYRKWMMYAIFVFAVIFMGIESYDPRVLVDWPALTIGITLYYIYLRELQFSYDTLTGVFNRMSFAEAVTTAGGEMPVTMVMLDLNGLKDVNDAIGHAQGDAYIVAAADLISSAFEGVGIVYRIGGDEFCVICRGVSPCEVRGCVDELRLRTRDYDEQADYSFSIACGVAERESGSESLYQTLSRADRNMYSHKSHRHPPYFREGVREDEMADLLDEGEG